MTDCAVLTPSPTVATPVVVALDVNSKLNAFEMIGETELVDPLLFSGG